MNKKEVSEKQEEMISRFLGWERVKGSGARPLYPGDVEDENWLGECKTHMKPNSKIVFDFSVWSKIVDEASSRFKYPVLFTDDGSQNLHNTFCLVDLTGVISPNSVNEDYSSRSRLSFDLDYLKSHSFVFKRNEKCLCVMSIEEFAEYLSMIC